MKEHDTGPYEPFGLEYDEGWAVFEIDRDDGLHLEIQRLESPQEARSWHPREPLFESDEAAIAFVRKRAEEGSQYHREALAIHGKIEPYHDMEEVESNMPYVEPEKTAFEWRQEVNALKAEIVRLNNTLRALKDQKSFAETLILDIQEILDGTVWEMSMLSQIADRLTDNGWAVADRK